MYKEREPDASKVVEREVRRTNGHARGRLDVIVEFLPA